MRHTFAYLFLLGLFLLAFPVVGHAVVTTNLPLHVLVNNVSNDVANVQANDAVFCAADKDQDICISRFPWIGGEVTSVVLHVEFTVEDGYDGTNAIQVNGINTTIVPANGDADRTATVDLAGGGFQIDSWPKISSLAITFVNNDAGTPADAVSFDYAYLVVDHGQPGSFIPPTWSEEFESVGQANPAIWEYEEGYQRNNEDQYYVVGPSNGWQEGGLFIIEGRDEPMGGMDYTSASIYTKNKYYWLYGRAQIRAQIPAMAGLWPAIWGCGKDSQWPHNGEVDIMEYYGEDILANCAVGGTTAWSSKWFSSHTSVPNYFVPVDPGWRTNFHVWTMQWDQQYVRLYIDNVLLKTVAQTSLKNSDGFDTSWGPNPPYDPAYPFKQPFHCWLNLAIGGNNGGDPTKPNYPVRYCIDYWRVWEGATNNVAPTDIALSANSVGEGLAAGTVIGELSATDADPAEVLRYSLVAGTGDDDNSQFEAQAFVSDNTTRSLLKAAEVLNYNDGATRSIRVRVTDIEGATYDKVFTINVIPTPAIDVSTNAIVVVEGGTANFDVRLRTLPANTVTVKVSRTSGDADLWVSIGNPLYFTPGDGTNWQQVTIAAAEDGDWTNASAVFSCEDPAAGYDSATVTATESDNDNLPPVADAGASQTVFISGGADWTPAQLAVAAWYDAADAGTITESGGFVSQWDDKSGNGRHMAQGTGGIQPGYSGTAWDGALAAVTFDNVDDYLEHVTQQVESVMTLAVAMEQENTSRDDRAFGIRGASSNTKKNFAIACDNSLRYDGANSAAGIPASVGKHLRVATRTLISQVDHFDGTPNINDSLTLPDVDGFINAGNVSAGLAGPFGSKIAEGIVIYDAVTDETRWKLEGYLAHKWGLEGNLPSNHTYKAAAPQDAAAIATLNPTVSDPNGDSFTAVWSVISGPAGTVFGDANAATTTATFVHEGTYTLRLTVADHLEQAYDEVTINVGSDDDSDGMLDAWEISHFGNLTNSAGQGSDDQDGDGFIDLYEYLAGTDPTNDTSLLVVTDSQQGPATNQFVLTWQAVSNKNYVILSKSALTNATWFTNETGIPGVEPLCVHTVETTGARCYYLLRLEN